MAAKALTVEQCREALDVLARCEIVEFRGEEFTV